MMQGNLVVAPNYGGLDTYNRVKNFGAGRDGYVWGGGGGGGVKRRRGSFPHLLLDETLQIRVSSSRLLFSSFVSRILEMYAIIQLF